MPTFVRAPRHQDGHCTRARPKLVAREVELRAGYRLQKYIRRHRISLAAAVVIAALLVTFGIVQAVELRRITRERDRANRIAAFMTDMFKLSAPTLAGRVAGRVPIR
jgi:hypothetical protein